MCLLFLLLIELLLHEAAALKPTDTFYSAAHASRVFGEEIDKFKKLISSESRLHHLLVVDDIVAGWNRSLIVNSTEAPFDENAPKVADIDGLKNFKKLLKTTKMFSDMIPEAGQYIKAAATAIEFIINEGEVDDDAATIIRHLDHSIEEARIEILEKLSEIQEQIGEGPFEEIRAKAGTLLRFLMDALAGIAERNKNYNWWRPVWRFLQVSRMRDPEVLVNDVEQLLYSPNRYLIYTLMRADNTQKNETLQRARTRITNVLHTLAFVKTFQAAMFEDEETYKYEADQILSRVRQVTSQVDIDVQNFVNEDLFQTQTPALIKVVLRNYDRSDLQATAKKLLAALEETAKSDRYVVIVSNLHKKENFGASLENKVEFMKIRYENCLLQSFYAADKRNIYEEVSTEANPIKNRIVVYRSKKAHLMSSELIHEFQQQYARNTSDGTPACDLRRSDALRNASANVGFMMNTICEDIGMAVDSRVLLKPAIYQCNLSFGNMNRKMPQHYLAFP